MKGRVYSKCDRRTCERSVYPGRRGREGEKGGEKGEGRREGRVQTGKARGGKLERGQGEGEKKSRRGSRVERKERGGDRARTSTAERKQEERGGAHKGKGPRTKAGRATALSLVRHRSVGLALPPFGDG